MSVRAELCIFGDSYRAVDFGTCGVPFKEVPLHNSLISLKLNWPMSGDDRGVLAHFW